LANRDSGQPCANFGSQLMSSALRRRARADTLRAAAEALPAESLMDLVVLAQAGHGWAVRSFSRAPVCFVEDR
jgi:hypothetical protein